MITFANPLGFLALLAIPAILAIHFLQRESRRLEVSTLFLLENLAPESSEGRRFQRLRQSVPLWMQLLAAVLAAWLLAQPRWLRRDSVQRVVLVLDSSISMAAFKSELERELEQRTAKLAQLAGTTEWQLLESDPSRPVLYAGTDRLRLLRAARAFEPHLGTHDFLPTLNLARTYLRGSGTLVFVSDRPAPLPEGAHLLAIGRPLENCGFTGATCTGRHWQALVRNHGGTPQQRSWWIEAQKQKSPPQTITLEAGQSLTIAGDFPTGAEACEVMLSPDEFTVDDRLPLVAPKPKLLTIAVPAASPFGDFFQRLAGTIEDSAVQAMPADLRIAVYDPLRPAWPESTSIVFTSDPSAATSKPLAGEVVAENHPLMAGLGWNGIVFPGTIQAPMKKGDEVLLWAGDRPLIYLRENEAASLLVINFDLRASNAPRLPAFVILLNRFAERVRAAKIAPESRNVETNQVVTVAFDKRLEPPAIEGATPGLLRAPARPGFFMVKQGGRALLTAAAQFADSREADFREAATQDTLAAVEAQLMERNTQPDFLAPLWMLLLVGALVVNWAAGQRRGDTTGR
jgi:hypothetical protein